MSKDSFIDGIVDMFNTKIDKKASKKENIKTLICKLEKRRAKLKKALKHVHSKEKRDDLKLSIAIIKKQIKKGKKLLG